MSFKLNNKVDFFYNSEINIEFSEGEMIIKSLAKINHGIGEFI